MTDDAQRESGPAGDPAVWVIDYTGTVADEDAMAEALRDLVQASRDRGAGRSWAVLGELTSATTTTTSMTSTAADGRARVDEDSRAVVHDRVGRRAVRLAVDVVVSVGTGRANRALHQGAVMEGSWGDESRLVPDAGAATVMLLDEVAAGDVVLVAGGAVAGAGPSDLSVVVRSLLDDVRCMARRVER